MYLNLLSRSFFILLISVFLWTTSQNAASAASAEEIDARVSAKLEEFYREVGAAKDLAAKAEGILVFPEVAKAGLVVGGEYGEGSLSVDEDTVGYYSTTSASIGLQIGVQTRAEIIMFMTEDALTKFQNSKGWEAGVDGSVALIKTGASGKIDTTNIKDPVIGFIFSEKGLMANVNFEGSKISKLER